MTGQRGPESDDAGTGSLAGALAGLLDHFFSTIGKHQPGCAIEPPAPPAKEQEAGTVINTTDEKTGTAE
jgi:hypothetical protein